MTTSLHTKYRPKSFGTVVGQDATVKSLEKIIERKASHAFILSGPSGVGKTTLARIAAKAVGCDKRDIMEIDAATYTGIDQIRRIQEALQYKPISSGSSSRAVVLDECHALSKSAWQSLLKVVEEPPSHAYFFFCTTEMSKVPQTIKTRCTAFTLKSVSDADLKTLVNRVCKKEEIKLDSSVVDAIITESFGSPRQALVNLTLCRDVTSKKEALTILKSAQDSDAVLNLCRFLAKGGSWSKAMGLVNALDEENPESVRIVVTNYMAGAAKRAKSEKEAAHFLNVLDAFSEPYNQSDKHGPLILSIGRVLLNS